jgi:hypothetical protein
MRSPAGRRRYRYFDSSTEEEEISHFKNRKATALKKKHDEEFIMSSIYKSASKSKSNRGRKKAVNSDRDWGARFHII